MNIKIPHINYKTVSLFVFSIIIGGLLWSDSVSAQWALVTAGSSTESLSDAAFNILWTILNALYIITLPVLILAWKAMDNSMIYGEFMNLDKPLYMLWNMSRTFANFAIGWVLLWKVFNYIFSKDTEWPVFIKNLIIKSIAIVLGINFSRFALGALLDLSTIGTYSLWAMPLGAIKEVNGDKDMPILSIVSYFNFQSNNAVSTAGTLKVIDPYIYYKRGAINIPECEDFHHGIILWPKYYPTITNKTDVSFTGWNIGTNPRQYCVINTQTLADITDLETWKDTHMKEPFYTWWRENNSERNRIMKNIVQSLEQSTSCTEDIEVSWTSGTTGTILGSNIMELKDNLKFWERGRSDYTFCKETTTPLVISKNAYNETGRKYDFINGWQAPYGTQPAQTFNNLFNQSKGMVWPFVTLYMTLLNFSNLSHTSTQDASINNTIGGLLDFTLKAIISIAVFVPLIALAAILIIRVILLWGIIAFIPLWIVYKWLEGELPKWLKWGGDIKTPAILWWASFDAKWIIWLIFAPIVPVFVLSISIIILQTFQIELSKSMDSENQTRAFFGISSSVDQTDPSITCTDFWGLQQMCYKSDPDTNVWSSFANLIPRLFLNIFWIGLMWMLMKIAISSTGMASKVGETVMGYGKEALGAIPIPGLGGAWSPIRVGTLGRMGDIIERSADAKLRQVNQESDNVVNSYFNPSSKQPNEEPQKNMFTISNTEAVKTKMKEKGIVALNDSKITNRLNSFSEVLEKEDKQAYSQFWSLTTIADKSQALLNYINSDLDPDNKLRVDRNLLIKSILEPKLYTIRTTTESTRLQELKSELKSFIENDEKLWNGTSIIKLFETEPVYKNILDEVFWTNNNSPNNASNP